MPLWRYLHILTAVIVIVFDMPVLAKIVIKVPSIPRDTTGTVIPNIDVVDIDDDHDDDGCFSRPTCRCYFLVEPLCFLKHILHVENT